MKTKPKHNLFDDLVIFICKGAASILLGIAVICAAILLYSFVKNVLFPAFMVT